VSRDVPITALHNVINRWSTVLVLVICAVMIP